MPLLRNRFDKRAMRWRAGRGIARAGRVSPSGHGGQVPEAPACRGEAVGPAPVGVRPQAEVRSPPKVWPSVLRPLHTQRGGLVNPPPSGGLKQYDLHATAGGVAFKSF